MFTPAAVVPQMGMGSLGQNPNATMVQGTAYPMIAAGGYPNQLTSNTLAASLIRGPNQANMDTSATSYYVFHPRLTQVESAHAEKPSLLEMETNYLVRHQRQQQRAQAFQSRKSYSLNDEDTYQQQQITGSTGAIPHTKSLLTDKRQQFTLVPANFRK